MIRTRGGTVLTEHAVEAMLERNVGPDEVDEVIARPEQSYPWVPAAMRSHEARTTHQRRDIAVVTAVRGGQLVVVTVLYRLPEQWRSAQGRPSGRALSRTSRRRLEALLRRERAARVVAS